MFTSRFRVFFYGTTWLSTATGLALVYFMLQPADFFPTLRQALLKTHVAGVVAWLFLCGMLFSIHVIPQLVARMRQGLRTGVLLIGLVAAMTLSGFALQVIPWPPVLETARWIHFYLSVLFVLLLIIHLLLVRPELKTWVIAIAVISLLALLPLMSLKQTEAFPDEIQLTPRSGVLPEKKTP
ncbi:MAG: hypothetical protein ACOY5B_12575 [Spirochaetota bacterium]